MNEQQYRFIADRDEGDDPKPQDIQDADRYVLSGPFMGDSQILRIERPVLTAAVDELLAAGEFQDPQPMQECGVCGRNYSASDTRDTCPVCWPGFGEYAQQSTPSAELDVEP
ncbi:hypothetical protein [Curtobacterium sp. MCBD17_008]|uniref:hypothetical protein n=1 Tax=Curtobacterium sp. MCBD17_008 TaxID=2175656 RepID=UPI000DAA5D76|nr:hypothetical protein [Curtobacterium sp. MCBD17_008]PZE92504.1 hypothetical protein DEI95_08245 [Curtobacterium sp. MCBD17_008]